MKEEKIGRFERIIAASIAFLLVVFISSGVMVFFGSDALWEATRPFVGLLSIIVSILAYRNVEKICNFLWHDYYREYPECVVMNSENSFLCDHCEETQLLDWKGRRYCGMCNRFSSASEDQKRDAP